MVLRAVDSGINYFDTAPDYGQSEETIGEAMGKIPAGQGHHYLEILSPPALSRSCRYGLEEKDYIAAVEGSLSRMKTDYLDFCFVHAIGEMSKDLEAEKERLLSNEMFEAVTELKKAGKVRFLGTSSTVLPIWRNPDDCGQVRPLRCGPACLQFHEVPEAA